MSITFSLRTIDGDLACSANHGAGCTSTEHFEMDAWMDMPGYDLCFECQSAQEAACPICSLEVNMSNANAMQVIERLGIEFDYCGSIGAADLLGRAMTGNVGRDDSGVSTVERGGPGTGTARIIECGLPAGYFDGRLEQLARLAAAALAGGLSVSWC